MSLVHKGDALLKYFRNEERMNECLRSNMKLFIHFAFNTKYVAFQVLNAVFGEN